MNPFEPIGDQARWKTVYAVLEGKVIGDVVTYVELGEALELDPDEDRHAIQMAVRRAAKEFAEVRRHALDALPNEGYRVVLPAEHLELAQRHQKKSRKALERGHHTVTYVDFNGMDGEVRKAFEVTAQAMGMMLDMSRQLDLKQKRLQEAVDSVVEKSNMSEAQLVELQERMERLERINRRHFGEGEPGAEEGEGDSSGGAESATAV